MTEQRKPRKALYHHQDLIRTTLHGCGVDSDEPSTWHRLKADDKMAVARRLSENAKLLGIDADESYALSAIRDWFGNRRGGGPNAEETQNRKGEATKRASGLLKKSSGP